MVCQNLIRKLAKDKHVLRKTDIISLSEDQLDNISDILINQCKIEICTGYDRIYDYDWSKRKDMWNVDRVFRPRPKLERIKQKIINNLGEPTLDIRYTHSHSPEYKYHIDQDKHDWVVLPYPERFHKLKFYYKTLFHELAHAAFTRCGIEFKHPEEEEVIVEGSALVICFIAGYNLWDSCESYMNEWSNPRFKDIKSWDNIIVQTKNVTQYLITGIKRF